MDEQAGSGVQEGDDDVTAARPPTRRELRQQRAAQEAADAYADEPWDRTIERPARKRVPMPVAPDEVTGEIALSTGEEPQDARDDVPARGGPSEDGGPSEGHAPLPEPPPLPPPPRVLPVAPVAVLLDGRGALAPEVEPQSQTQPESQNQPESQTQPSLRPVAGLPPVLPVEPDEDDVPESPEVPGGLTWPAGDGRSSATPWAPTSRSGAGEGAGYRWTDPPSPFRGLGAAGGEPALEELPTLTDLLSSRPEPATGPAESGWQGGVRKLTGGLIAPPPGAAEVRRRTAVATVQRSLDGPRTIVVLNPKGGAHKTTASLLIAATFGIHRGGYTLAWDNNETRGTLGWRSHQARHHNTAVNLLQDLGRFSDPGSARVGDLDNYVRAQGSAQFDVLASDEDAASAASIDAEAFTALHRTLARFYRVMVIDTGNNMRASNWRAAVEAADQLVIVSTVREDTSQSAAWAVDALRVMGHGEAVSRAVTVLSAPAPRVDPALTARLHEHFGRLTRTVQDVPYDPALVAGGPLDVEALAPSTREAWLHVTAAVAEGL